MMAVLGLTFAHDLARQPAVVVALLATLGACLATAAVLFSRSATDLAGSLLRLTRWKRVERIGRSLLDAVRDYSTSHRELLNVLAGSLGVQVLRILQAWCLGLALGVVAPGSAYFAFIPLILLVMLVPISIYGIGTSQLAFLLFARAGVPDAQSFALSVLFLALGVFGNLPGLALYLAGAGAEQDAGSDVTA
jgi:hypothetical protein